MECSPRKIATPFRPIPLDTPEGMTPNEFFNSAENLNDLIHNNGLLANPEGLLMYRKALGHTNELERIRCSAERLYRFLQDILFPGIHTQRTKAQRTLFPGGSGKYFAV